MIKKIINNIAKDKKDHVLLGMFYLFFNDFRVYYRHTS
jgi:hypothetical protein